MTPPTRQIAVHVVHATTDADSATVYPIETLALIHRLLKKLGMTSADGLQLLAEVLTDLDRQIEDYEAEGDGLPFPPNPYD